MKSNSLFIIDLTYTAPLDQLDAAMPAHMKFLKKYYTKNIFLASGRKMPRTGGMIVALGVNKDFIAALMNEDPFCQGGLATYTITEFQTSQTHPTMKVLLDGLRDSVTN